MPGTLKAAVKLAATVPAAAAPSPRLSPRSNKVEEEFWRIVDGSLGAVSVEYGADVDTGDVGSGFPQVCALMHACMRSVLCSDALFSSSEGTSDQCVYRNESKTFLFAVISSRLTIKFSF